MACFCCSFSSLASTTSWLGRARPSISPSSGSRASSALMSGTSIGVAQARHRRQVPLPTLAHSSTSAPWRGFIIFAYSMINFIPLVAFYDLLLGDQQIFYVGPTSKRDQIQRHLADRTGIMGTAQLPLLIMMASKRTPLAIVSGLGMNRLMLYHRWISRWFLAHILIHTAVWTVSYAQTEGIAVMLADTYIKWGCVGFSAICALVFCHFDPEAAILRSLRPYSHRHGFPRHPWHLSSHQACRRFRV